MKNIKLSFPIIAAILVIVGGGLLLALANSKKKEEQVKLPLLVEEFGDYECPACGAFHPIVNEIKEKYKDQIDFQFKHFPLITIHPRAYESSIAAEAAREQGKFAEYSDLLYKNQDKLQKEDLVKYAKELGLDVTKFEADMAKAEIKARVDADMAEGDSRNVSATPTFYINGEKVVFVSNSDEGPQQKLERIINEKLELGKKQAEQAKSE